MAFYLGKIITLDDDGNYPEGTTAWCDANGCRIEELDPEDGVRQFKIAEIPKETEEEKQERIDNLTMTAQDFLNVLNTAGLSFEQIDEFLTANVELKLRLITCQNVYCKAVKSFMPLTVGGITITSVMVEKAFKEKNGVS